MKLDFGCGPNPKEGFEGVDIREFGGKVKHVLDLRGKWPWEDNSVDEAYSSHFIEHLEPQERIHFANELYRVLKSKSTCTIITPHWSSARAYGDLTHKWPPVSEFWLLYLNEEWRKNNAPHNDEYTCNFSFTHGYTLHPTIAVRNIEFQQFAASFYKEAMQDLIFTLIK